MLQDKPGDGRRWPRGQKFSLSSAGREAHEAYRQAVQEARGVGRGALDAALSSWASPRKVQAEDGVLLGELLAKPRGLADLSKALEDAGTTATEVRGAIIGWSRRSWSSRCRSPPKSRPSRPPRYAGSAASLPVSRRHAGRPCGDSSAASP